jgi:hypothetical protein
MVLLQSCTVFLPVLQCSCSETSATCIDAYDVISVKCEEDSDIGCQGEGNPIAISFPTIKCEQDEVSYICVSIVGCIVSISRNAYCHSSPSYLCQSFPLGGPLW